MNLAQRIAQEFKTIRNDELTLKANQSSTYTKTETDAKIVELAPATDISGKADKATTYTKTEVDSAIPTNVSDLTNDSGFQTGSQVDSKIAVLTALAPATLDTFKEIADQLVTDQGAVAALTSVVSNKVDKVTGKGLSTEDYTSVEKTKLGGIATGAQVNTVASVAGKTGVVSLVKADVGLSNVDNTTDLLKPISTATQTALDGKVDDAQVLTNVPAGAVFTDTVYTHPASHPASIITQDASNRFVTDTEKTTWNGKASTSVATTSANGLMASTDKTKLDAISGTNTGDETVTTIKTKLGITTLSGSNTGDQTTITGNAGTATKLATARTINGVAFDGTANITINAVDTTARVASSLLGVANGVATLDAGGLVPSSQLPSYVDDVLEFANLAGFPSAGTTGKIYVALDTNKTYRWSGSAYVYITSGAVDSVAGKAGVVTLVKGDVGLGSVDNTSDANKPISTATQTALNAKVDKVTGKGLSTEDYTSAEKTKLAGIAAGAQVNTVASVAGRTGAVVLAKADVGLGSVDNTADASKPISTATQTALDLKAPLASPTFTGTVTGVTKTMVGLGNVDNTADSAKNVLSATKLTTARTINGVSFDGTANITVADSTKLPLAGGTLTGAVVFAGGQTWPTFNQSTTGNAATATKLGTARTISLTGDVTGSVSFDGSANAAITTTVAANSVALGTDTTGNYVAGNTAGTGIAVTGTADEGWSPTISLATAGTAGSYSKVTTDVYGRVTSGTTLSASDIPVLDASKITTGTIDAARLPSYVDDVIEGANLASFPATGETGKIYVDLATNKTYRWSGSAYVYITSGAVDSVAGKTGVITLVKADVGLGSADNTSDANKPVSTAQASAIALKANIASPVFTGNVTGLGVATGTSFNSITGLSSTTPLTNGTAAIGTGTTAARADHVHPSDTTKLSLTGGTLTGTIFNNDSSRYWLATATNWGMYWNITDNALEFHGAGVTKAKIDLDDGVVTAPVINATTSINIGSTQQASMVYNATQSSIDFIIN
jgi:hypothetical protein